MAGLSNPTKTRQPGSISFPLHTKLSISAKQVTFVELLVSESVDSSNVYSCDVYDSKPVDAPKTEILNNWALVF